MQLSKYTIIVDDAPKTGEQLIFNTRTHALVKVDQGLKAALAGFDVARRKTSRRPPVVDLAPYQNDLKALFRMGILVKDDADDHERLMRFMDQRKYGVDQSKFVASILTTYSCNFACTYCFEESTRTSGQKLNQPTSDTIMAWLKKKVERLGVKQLVLNYYGGEPLLNQHAIEYISGHMQKWCESVGIRLRMYLQTNGALLTPELVDRYIALGLEGARVSVDGTRELHDKQRPMRGSGEGTFDTVMKNLVAVVDKIKISIAAGYDKGDPSDILVFINYLDETGILKKLDQFVTAPIHPTLGPAGRSEALVSPGCISNYESDTLLSATRIINNALKAKGFPVGSGLSTSMCPLTREDGGVTIDTNGLIFKCNSMLGHPELAVGNVREDEYNAKQKEFMATDAWKKCDADCPYVPLCNMGCRLISYFKTLDWSAKSCERSYMDRFVPTAIKNEYDIRMKEKKEDAVSLPA